MGNYASCVECGVPATVHVVGIDGSVAEFRQGMKAAELMLENPNHFLCHSTALVWARRRVARPLSADDDLELGHVYFLLPMLRLNSALSVAEVAALTQARAHPGFRRSLSHKHAADAARIRPVSAATASSEPPPLPRLRHDSGDDGVVGGGVPPAFVGPWRLKIQSAKAWRPVLEPITESPRVRPHLGPHQQPPFI